MKRAIFNSFIVCFLLLLASCGKKTEYTNAIPKDANAVISVDMASMVQKSGLNQENGKVLVERISNALKSGLSGKSYKAMEDIIKEPSASGISFKDKLFLFSCANSNQMGLLAKVDDEDDLEDMFQTLNEEGISSALHDGDNCKWAKMGNVLCAFNSGTLMLLSNVGDDISGLKETLMSYMRQEKEKSFSGTAAFSRLSSSKGDIAMVLNMSLLPSDIITQLKVGMSADMKLEELKYLVDMSFETGKIVVKSESLITDNSMIEALTSFTATANIMNGDLMEYFPSNTLQWCGTSIDGKNMYSVLCRNKAISQMLNEPMLPIDFQEIFSSLKGEIALGCINMSDVLLYAKVTDTAFLDSFEQLIPLAAMTGGQMVLKKTGPDAFFFSMMGENLWFGVKNGMLYITNNSSLAANVCQKYGSSLLTSPFASSLKGENRAVGYVSFEQMVSEANTMSDYNVRMALSVLKFFDYATIMVPDWKSGEMDIILKDKSVNALQLVVRELQNI